MQREYKVCPPGLLDGVVVPLAEEALRAVQNRFQVYKTLLSEHATNATNSRPLSTCYHPYC
jgi:hypothetical protein